MPGETNLPKRIQRRRVKGWRMPRGAVYVGRGTHYGNPYLIADDCQHISWFRADLLREMAARRGPTDPDSTLSLHFWRMARKLPLLRGRALVCWCRADVACHADVLLEIANADA